MWRTILFLFVLLAVTSVAQFAQSSGSSVMVHTYSTGGTDAEGMSLLLRDQILIGLEKYPCVDQMDDGTLAALIGYERMRDLLGKELDQSFLTDLAGAVGARYVVTIKSYTLPNGTTYSSVTIWDGVANKPIDMRDSKPASGNESVKNGDALAAQIVQLFDQLFKGKCDPHWTGTISYSLKQKEEKTESGDSWGGSVGVMEKNAKFTRTTVNSLDDTIEVVLRPNTDGGSPAKPMARVARRFARRWERTERRTSDVLCRPRGKPSFTKSTASNTDEFVNESGSNTATLPVTIIVFPSGQFKITVSFPLVPTTRESGRKGVRDGCESVPFNESDTVENPPRPAEMFEIDGQIDPKNPDVLIGTTVTGDLRTKQTTITWKLKMVRPRKK